MKFVILAIVLLSGRSVEAQEGSGIARLPGSRPERISVRSPAVFADSEDLINPDRPGIADGSRVIRPGQIQVEVGIQDEKRRENAATHSHTFFVPALVRLGVLRQIELRIESNSFISNSTSSDGVPSIRAEGYSPVSLGAKYQLYDSRSEERKSLGLIVRVFPPSGSADFRSTRFTGDARLAADWDFAPKFSLNPNVGLARLQDDTGRTYSATLSALTLNYLPTERVNPFIDAGLQYPEQPHGATSITLDAGIALIVNPDMQLDLSAGRGVQGDTPPRPFVSLGVSLRSDVLARHR